MESQYEAALETLPLSRSKSSELRLSRELSGRWL
jgi:hypothetical protein